MKHLAGEEVETIGNESFHVIPASQALKCLSPGRSRKAQRKGRQMALIKYPLCTGALYILMNFNFHHFTGT